MRRAVAVHSFALAAFLLLSVVGRAEETTTTTTAPKEPPPVQETQVHGTVPDLSGRWLALVALELPDGQNNTLPAFWDISQQDGKPTMIHRYVDLPRTQKAAVDAAGAEGKSWSPAPDDLAAIAAAWDDLPPIESHVKHINNDIAAKDGFDEKLLNEPRTRDAMFVIRQRMDLHPSGAPVIRYAFVYSIMAAADRDYTGNFDGVTVAAAPFPIPITVKGSLHLYRIKMPAAPPAAGFFSRLLDQLRGCGASR